jgi:hypothetical protein
MRSDQAAPERDPPDPLESALVRRLHEAVLTAIAEGVDGEDVTEDESPRDVRKRVVKTVKAYLDALTSGTLDALLDRMYFAEERDAWLSVRLGRYPMD